MASPLLTSSRKQIGPKDLFVGTGAEGIGDLAFGKHLGFLASVIPRQKM